MTRLSARCGFLLRADTTFLRLLIAVVVLLTAVPEAGAMGTLPDVDVILVIEVSDANAWLAMHEEVLGTAAESPKALGVTVAGATGGQRSLTIYQPRFDTEILLHSGARSIKVVVAGKVPGNQGLSTLTHFKAAVLAMQAGVVSNEIVLSYGLTGVSAQLLVLHLSRP